MSSHISLDEFMAAILGGDSVSAAVQEGRCVSEPIGCGLPVFDTAGNLRHTMPDDAPEEYVAEWQMTGLCADCQDALEGIEDEDVKRHSRACADYSAFLDLWAEMLEQDDD
ncbi:hypothetical protein [Streptomyces sp. NPDC051286]|uniref:hypothetical protein n=1 Tax=Streptomyces sp. NPDC051286 TaxID=3365647 RepID=UPI00378AEDDA